MIHDAIQTYDKLTAEEKFREMERTKRRKEAQA